MKARRAGSADGPVPRADDASRAKLARSEAARRRQEMVIATLSEAVSHFHRGLKALRDENAELRAETADLRERLAARSRADDELVELAIGAGPAAPAIARRAVTGALAERATAAALVDAQLVTSELVSNGVRHGGMSAGDELVLRLRAWAERCRVEVEDTGRDGVIAPLPPDASRVGGTGLNLVQELSERWGVVRAADGPTRVWAQLECRG